MEALKHPPRALQSQPGHSRGNTDVISQASGVGTARPASPSRLSPSQLEVSLDMGQGSVLPHIFHKGAGAFLHGTPERCPGVAILASPHLARHLSSSLCPAVKWGWPGLRGVPKAMGHCWPVMKAVADGCYQRGCYHHTHSGSGGGKSPML